MVLSNMCTVFRVHYRTQFGDSISIRGSYQGLSWLQGQEASWVSEHGEDVWILSLPCHYWKGEVQDPEDVIYFKPLINDEVWAKGLDYVVRAGDVIDIYPFFFATNGTMFRTVFQSHILNNKRRLAIYLPPSYKENRFKRYPVILFQDGHNLFDTQHSFCGDTWQIGQTMDHLCCTGGIEEYIVVGIYPVKREWEYLPTRCGLDGGGADKYLDSLTIELRPSIDAVLRTIPGPSAIAGSSYGGIIALYAWATRPDQFNVCGSFSPALKWDNGVVISIVKQCLSSRPNDHKLYIDCGTIKDEKKAVLRMVDYLFREAPLNEEQLLFVLAEGHEHTERHWAMRAPAALVYMFADPNRAQIMQTYTSGDEMSE